MGDEAVSTVWRFRVHRKGRRMLLIEFASMKNQIENLTPVTILLGDRVVNIVPTLVLSMVEGKICSSVLNVSSQKCYICGSTPKEMNNRSKVLGGGKWENPASFEFGLSPLHAKIRRFECLLHLSYRLDVKEWQVRSAEDK